MTDSSLEPRFLEPDGWRWDFFADAQSQRIRYGGIDPTGGKPTAVVVALPGLSEFCEKYFEVARDMLGRNLSFRVLDWRGQGKSGRYLANPQKRHSEGFDRDVADLHELVTKHIQPAAGGAKLVMLAHSMGGNLGLRYLNAHPGVFAAAAFSTPMLGIRAANVIPGFLRLRVASALKAMMNERYIFGGGDWRPGFRDKQAKNLLSGDPVRAAVHNEWCLRDPQLQVGNITFGWMHEALASCSRLTQPGVAERIAVPCLFAVAGHDMLVDNKAILAFARRVPGARILELPDACHEILMERDPIRDKFLAAFDQLLAGVLNTR